MTSLNIMKKANLDDYNTPKYVWDILTDYFNLDKNIVIYEPFYSNGNSKKYLEELDYKNIIHNNECFFENYKKYEFDIIISNPPYTIKQKILKILYEIDKPFILIVPTSIISKLYMKNIFKHDLVHIQYVIPQRRLQFERLDGYNQRRTCFDTLFLCYKMNLPRDVNYI